MKPGAFPPLILNKWKETRDTLHKYCRLVGAIREAMAIPLPDAFHTNLVLCKKGFTTLAMPKNESSPEQSFEVILDVMQKKLIIESNYREPLSIALTGQSLNALCDETCSLLTDIGIKPPLEKPSFLDGTRGSFEPDPINAFWKAIKTIRKILQQLKTELPGKTSPIQLCVDDFTLSIIWQRKNVFQESNLEQIEFGFSTGDQKHGEAYFFIRSFPVPGALVKIMPTEKTTSFSGADREMILLYSDISNNHGGKDKILDFYQSVLR
jgi:hypothetical protein